MNDLVRRFQQIHGQSTRQIGRLFCIPAAVSNALRILGGELFTQELIRDAWYRQEGRTPEASLDEQMTGAGPGILGALGQCTDFDSRFTVESFEREPERSFFNPAKSDEAIEFIATHAALNHPVMVSTDHIPWEQGMLRRICCHMWLILDIDISGNYAIAHDPGSDDLFQVPLRMTVPLKLGDQTMDLEIGLRSRITTSNYFCLAFGTHQG